MKRNHQLLILVLLSIAYIVVMIPLSLGILVAGIMGLAAEGGGFFMALFFLSTFFIPLTSLFGIGYGWITFAKKKKSFKWTYYPFLINVALCILFLVLSILLYGF